MAILMALKGQSSSTLSLFSNIPGFCFSISICGTFQLDPIPSIICLRALRFLYMGIFYALLEHPKEQL